MKLCLQESNMNAKIYVSDKRLVGVCCGHTLMLLNVDDHFIYIYIETSMSRVVSVENHFTTHTMKKNTICFSHLQ